MNTAVVEDRDLRDLPESLSESFKEAFDLFDRNNAGTITMQDLPTVLRAVGQNPTEEEIKHYAQEVDPRGRGCIDFQTFQKLAWRKLKAQNTSEELEAAFRFFDTRENGENHETGFLPAQLLRDIMTRIGEPITNGQVDEMIRVADVDGTGKVDYRLYTRLVFADVPKVN